MTPGPAIEPPDTLTIDMVHQVAYCARRLHLMYVDGRWEDNAFTAEGTSVHRRVDARASPLPEPGEEAPPQPDGEGDPPPAISRSVSLESPTLGLAGKLDLVETTGGGAVPVETKRGAPPDNPEQSWEPQRVQLMAQSLLLRDNGFRVDRGILYFAGVRRRVEVPMDEGLEAATRRYLDQARSVLAQRDPPPPLDNSPKCNGCSLAGICLPDETSILRGDPDAPPDPRRLYPARDDALPLYIQEQGATVGKKADAISVTKQGAPLGRFLVKDISQIVLLGNITITAPAIHLLAENGIPILHHSRGWWFHCATMPGGPRNAYLRAAQYEAAADEPRRLEFARAIIAAKGRNQRTLLRRNAAPGPDLDQALARMAAIAERVPRAEDAETLLGLEGLIARDYFSLFPSMVRDPALAGGFAHEGRNRRPPRDPLNACLSYLYALLAKECAVALAAEGLDPWWGLLHRPRHGKPALALDLMEEFRPLLADSAVLAAANNGMVGVRDFAIAPSGCALHPAGRRSLIQAYENRLDQLATHPVFDYRASWRTLLRLQARLLGKWLRGDIPAYTGITTR